MSIMKIKNNVPQVYVAESRDFQLLTRVLDFVQNSVKFDIDTITNVIDTDTISDDYVDRLKSKIGFFTSNIYNGYVLRKVLSAFPYIIKYKGSEEGIERCVNTFLNIIGAREGSKVDIYNTSEVNDHTVRIGIESKMVDTTVLKDMLSYVLPTGYFVEIYFYTDANAPTIPYEFSSKVYKLDEYGPNANIVRSKPILATKDASSGVTKSKDYITAARENDTYNTVQLSSVYNPNTEKNERSHK